MRRLKAQVRQAALTHMPVRLTRGRATRLRSIRDFQIVERDIELPHLPPDLDNLRIAHLTDPHIGSLIGPERLPAMMDALQRLEADLIALTGDFIDLRHDVLDDVIAAMKPLQAPLGVWLVLGNHDHLMDGRELVDRFRDAKLGLLMDEHVVQQRGDERVTIAGIDFAHRRRQLEQAVARAMRGSPENAGRTLRILLSHHPHAFDAACRHGIDLTLSGHTHGGQLILSRGRSKKGSVGLANLNFRYTHGLYRRGHQYLYVSSGVGAWFPLRFNCPPEIACLRLCRACGAGESAEATERRSDEGQGYGERQGPQPSSDRH